MDEKRFKTKRFYNKKEFITEDEYNYVLLYRYEKGKLTCCSISNIKQNNNNKYGNKKKYSKFKSRAIKYK